MRDSSIDFLRTLGLCLVTLVHVNTLYSVSLLAYFGVPLMVFVSALCVKSSDTSFSLKTFGHRASRLLIPMWIFQTLYWLIFYKLETPSLYTIIQSYALLDLTPYTWIIRVFLILACLSPLLVRIANRLNHIHIHIHILYYVYITNCIARNIVLFICSQRYLAYTSYKDIYT